MLTIGQNNNIFKICELQSDYKFLTIPEEEINLDSANFILN